MTRFERIRQRCREKSFQVIGSAQMGQRKASSSHRKRVRLLISCNISSEIITKTRVTFVFTIAARIYINAFLIYRPRKIKSLILLENSK